MNTPLKPAETITLADLKSGQKAYIVKIKGRGAFRKRIMEMGFLKGKEVTVIKNAPLKDPIEYKILGYNVTLRRKEAGLIEVLAEIPPQLVKNGVSAVNSTEQFKRRARLKSKEISIALVGNPNCGKTTLFNVLSGSHERVGNYSGVTVDAKEARISFEGYQFTIVDLPGTYSLTAYTQEEIHVRNHIINQSPDIIVNVLDATNLERNLYLTTQLIDMDIRIVAALNMHDELEKKGDALDHENLGKMTGIPFVPTIASKGAGIEKLLQTVIDVYEDRNDISRHIHINYGHDIEKSISTIQNVMLKNDTGSLTSAVSSRFCSIKLLEKDKDIENFLYGGLENSLNVLIAARQETAFLENHLNEDTETLITDAKYGFISGALKENFLVKKSPSKTLSEKIDVIITHRLLGFPVFLAFMMLTFHLTFSLGKYPMDGIEFLMGRLSAMVSAVMPEGMLKSLIVDGALSGISGVIIFLPPILILFFMISFMEDTGYMARASFIMDRLMHRLGLHGKSFIPLIMGFGCNVPAIMATRTLESRNDRLLTMLIIPFMSCSARLPVYVLLIGAFFSSMAGTMLFIIYAAGILIAVISAMILKRIFFAEEEIPFVMELPPYRRPHLTTSLMHMWEKGVEYLKKIAGVILIASIIIWALGVLPLEKKYSYDYAAEKKKVETQYALLIDRAAALDKKNITAEKELKIREIKNRKHFESLEKSYIGSIGKAIQPLFAPLGFDWRMSVSIITGIAAKEIVVSTIGVLYQAGPDHNENTATLAQKIKNNSSDISRGNEGFTPAKALAFIFFILLYMPCVATIATIKKESGSWKWALFSVGYTFIVAWIVSFGVYQAGIILGRL